MTVWSDGQMDIWLEGKKHFSAEAAVFDHILVLDGKALRAQAGRYVMAKRNHSLYFCCGPLGFCRARRGVCVSK